MEWEEIREQTNKLKNTKYVIRNGSTGQFLCDNFGNIKIFYDIGEAKSYIRLKNLSSTYCICPFEEKQNV